MLAEARAVGRRDAEERALVLKPQRTSAGAKVKHLNTWLRTDQWVRVTRSTTI